MKPEDTRPRVPRRDESKLSPRSQTLHVCGLELRRLLRSGRYWLAVLFGLFAALLSALIAGGQFATVPYALYLFFVGAVTFATTSPILASDSVAFAPARPVSRTQVFHGRLMAHGAVALGGLAVVLLGSAVFGALRTQRLGGGFEELQSAERAGYPLTFFEPEAEQCYESWSHALGELPPSGCAGPGVPAYEPEPLGRAYSNEIVFVDSTRTHCFVGWRAEMPRHSACHYWNFPPVAPQRYNHILGPIAEPPLSLTGPGGRDCLLAVLHERPTQAPECQELAERLVSNSWVELKTAAAPWQQACVDWEKQRLDEVEGCRGVTLAAHTKTVPPGLILALLWMGCFVLWSVAALGWQPTSRARAQLTAMIVLPLALIVALEKAGHASLLRWPLVFVPWALACAAYLIGRRAWTAGDLDNGSASAWFRWRRWGWIVGLLGILMTVLVLLVVGSGPPQYTGP